MQADCLMLKYRKYCHFVLNFEPFSKATKMAIKDGYGCIRWQPDILPENETCETQKEKKQWLQQQSALFLDK